MYKTVFEYLLGRFYFGNRCMNFCQNWYFGDWCVSYGFWTLRYIYIQWNSVIARADGPGTFSRYCQVLVIPKWWIYQGKQREIILARTPTALCALEPDEEGRGLHTAQGRAFRCFSLLPATTRCALPGTWRQGGVGRVARTFVARKDRKSLVITKMIIH